MQKITSYICAALLMSVLSVSTVHASAWVQPSLNSEDVVTASIVKDQSVTLRTDTAFKEVRIANPAIADIVVMTNQTFQIMGKAGGNTNIMLYDSENRLVEIVDVEVNYDVVAINESIKTALPNSDIEAKLMANGIYLSGVVSNESTASRALKIAQAYAPDSVTDGLEIGQSHQVLLEVRFVEASREAVKELGVGLASEQVGNFAVQSTTAGLFSGANPALAGVLLGGAGSATLDTTIQALEEQGVIRTLAEPNLVSMSGETASFLAGGEFPIPVSADEGQIGIEFRQFGVSLSFTPTVRDDGVINLEVIPEVSQIDNTNSVRIAGIEIPSLRVRRANTSVELRSSQSFAIAGLLQNTSSSNKAQVPWMGDVPILGSLFRSTRFQNFETELVIIITPRLVQPVADQRELTTPLDVTAAPTELDLFLNGIMESLVEPSSVDIVQDTNTDKNGLPARETGQELDRAELNTATSKT